MYTSKLSFQYTLRVWAGSKYWSCGAYTPDSGWHLCGHSIEVGSHAKHKPIVEPFPSAASCSAANAQGAHELPCGVEFGNDYVAATRSTWKTRRAKHEQPSHLVVSILPQFLAVKYFHLRYYYRTQETRPRNWQHKKQYQRIS